MKQKIKLKRKKYKLKKKEWWLWLNRFLTFGLVAFSLIFFRANSTSDAFRAIGQIFTNFQQVNLLDKFHLFYGVVAIAILFAIFESLDFLTLFFILFVSLDIENSSQIRRDDAKQAANTTIAAFSGEAFIKPNP